ncbi:hypothetical protein L6164_018459 [Bauhinia variegata]|uniref:Uncharacterized protein n=1 Tax=Bauhinia variegata TaxID=167791 RepID=A0ACB9NC04_BAUVA|nr:hypothetical protein L6164_018459 [Bauhinia variegata]
MATVFESLSVSGSSLPSLTFSRITASSISSVSSPRSSAKLPHCKGLKLRPITANRFGGSVSSSSRLARRSGRLVCEAQNTAVEVSSINDANWQSLVLESESPVLVEFWAPWCGPCRMIHPVVGELAKQYAGKLKCYKINTDESPDIATRYGIRSIPTVMIFKSGEKKESIIGAVPKSTLTTSIEKFF